MGLLVYSDLSDLNKCVVTIHWCIHGRASTLLGGYLFDWPMRRLYKQLNSMWVLCCQYWLMYCNNGWLMSGVWIRVFVCQCCQQMYFHCWQWQHILLSMLCLLYHLWLISMYGFYGTALLLTTWSVCYERYLFLLCRFNMMTENWTENLDEK